MTCLTESNVLILLVLCTYKHICTYMHPANNGMNKEWNDSACLKERQTSCETSLSRREGGSLLTPIG